MPQSLALALFCTKMDIIHYQGLVQFAPPD
jgi:hypothetical protein